MDDADNPYRPPQGDGTASTLARPPKPISVWLMQGIYALVVVGRTLTIVRSRSVVDTLLANALALVLSVLFVVGIQLRHRWAQWIASVLLAVVVASLAAPTVMRFGESDGSAYELGAVLGAVFVAVFVALLVLLLGYKVTLGRASRSYFSWEG